MNLEELPSSQSQTQETTPMRRRWDNPQTLYPYKDFSNQEGQSYNSIIRKTHAKIPTSKKTPQSTQAPMKLEEPPSSQSKTQETTPMRRRWYNPQTLDPYKDFSNQEGQSYNYNHREDICLNPRFQEDSTNNPSPNENSCHEKPSN
jgi:hypothetical protein